MGGSISDLVPELQDFARALVDAAGAARLQPRVTSTVRTRSEQRRLYNRFLAGASGYPVAPPGASAHEYGLAFDMVVSPMEALADVGYTWQQWGGGWNPADAVHFELPGASEWARTQVEQDESIACGGIGGLLGLHCTTLYRAEDVVVGLATPFWKTLLVNYLLEHGFPDSEITKIVARPVSELHRLYPWLPF